MNTCSAMCTLLSKLYCVIVQGCVSVAFQKADNYRQKFEPYRDFYRQNEALDVEKFKEEDHGQSSTTYSHSCT